MTQTERNDVWAAGERYEPYVGRWSRLVARDFVDGLAVPADRDWLDVGCGTGALVHAIVERADPASVKVSTRRRRSLRTQRRTSPTRARRSTSPMRRRCPSPIAASTRPSRGSSSTSFRSRCRRLRK